MSQTVWITGASQGIGKALAHAYAKRGTSLALSARNPQDLQDLARTLSEIHQIKAAAYPLDVTEPDAVASTIQTIWHEFGPIDTGILNAGTHQPVNALNFKADGLKSLLDVNLMGIAHALEGLIPLMKEKRSGQIGLVASVAGYRGLPTASYYSPGKAAAIALAEAMRFDLQDAGIDIRLINPGFVKTPLTDKNEFKMPFLMEADQAAERIIKGLEGTGFEIAFPMRFILLLKLFRLLPYRFYFPLVSRTTRSSS